jgi:hypothetical protein
MRSWNVIGLPGEFSPTAGGNVSSIPAPRQLPDYSERAFFEHSGFDVLQSWGRRCSASFTP